MICFFLQDVKLLTMKTIISKCSSLCSILATTVALSFFSSITMGHEYRSEASKVMGVKGDQFLKIVDKSATAKVAATNAFIATLDDKLKKKLLHPLDSEERQVWTNIGTPSFAKGLRFSDLNADQVEAALKMLATIMGDAGYQTAVYVPLADDELIPVGEKQPSSNGYGVANFTILIFGEPSADKPWGLQYDGHHLVYNLTIHGEKMAMSPSFIGTRPSKFDIDGREIEPIKNLAEAGHAVVNSLNGEQKQKAIISKTHFVLRAGAGKDGIVPTPRGVLVSSFDDVQKNLLRELISAYTQVMAPEAAKLRNAELEKEIDQMYFAWGGATEVGKPMSYTLQGPTLIIEYACQGRGKRSLDHLHAMYRDPTNEYGAKYLK